MKTLYYRVPLSRVYVVYGYSYADIPVDFDGPSLRVYAVDKPRMMRASDSDGKIVVAGNEALIPFGRIGDALSINGEIPDKVTIR